MLRYENDVKEAKISNYSAVSLTFFSIDSVIYLV